MIWWLPFVLENKEAILERNRQIVEENLALMDAWIAKEPKASWISPASVSTSFVKLDVESSYRRVCFRASSGLWCSLWFR